MTCFSTASINYHIIRIPTSSSSPAHFAHLLEKFRKTKLAALLADPASFSASHGDEVLLPLEVWTQRLARPCTVFICVAGGDGGGYEEDEEEALMEREWVGMVTLRGPFSYELYRLSGPESPVRVEVEEEEEEGEDPETRWHLSNLWTSSAHRGRGLAKKMVQECLDFATSESKRLPGKDKARVRLIIKDEGSFLKRMYARMGFDETGRASLREAYIASGDEGCLPRDTSSKEELIGLWETRFGLVMERVLDCV